ncbi:hypothetical protein AMTRI_Chr05g72130 [Amborella trichopoda]
MNLGGMMNGFSIDLLNQSNYKIWRDTPTQENNDAFKKWRATNAKAESILKRFISHNLIGHIVNCKSACEIWIILDGLFNKKDNLCSEICLLVPEEPILEREYIPYVISIHGWAT